MRRFSAQYCYHGNEFAKDDFYLYFMEPNFKIHFITKKSRELIFGNIYTVRKTILELWQSCKGEGRREGWIPGLGLTIGPGLFIVRSYLLSYPFVLGLRTQHCDFGRGHERNHTNIFVFSRAQISSRWPRVMVSITQTRLYMVYLTQLAHIRALACTRIYFNRYEDTGPISTTGQSIR